MGYTLKVNHPHFPAGTEMNVGGLGRVPNGGSAEVDEETERLFMFQNGRTLDDAFSNDATVEVSGSSALDQSEVKQILSMFAEPETEAVAEVDHGTLFGLDNEPTNHDEGGEE